MKNCKNCKYKLENNTCNNTKSVGYGENIRVYQKCGLYAEQDKEINPINKDEIIEMLQREIVELRVKNEDLEWKIEGLEDELWELRDY